MTDIPQTVMIGQHDCDGACVSVIVVRVCN